MVVRKSIIGKVVIIIIMLEPGNNVFLLRSWEGLNFDQRAQVF